VCVHESVYARSELESVVC